MEEGNKNERIALTDIIPTEFFSDVTGKEISNCIQCEKFLLKQGTTYLIEKSIKRYPNSDATSTIFEYAICQECAMEWREKLSKDSAEKIDQFMGKYLSPELYDNNEVLRKGADISQWINKCLVTGKAITDSQEYQIACMCDGKQIIYGQLPYMISGEVMEQISELLSAETKEEMDGFMDKLYTGPPELKEYFRGRTPVII